MSNPVEAPHPNAEAMVAAIIRDNLGYRVYSSIPSKDPPTFPLVLVKRVGGTPKKVRIDRPNIQVEVYGTNKTEAYEMAALALAEVHGAEGESFAGPAPGTITDVRSVLGLTWAPDPVTTKDRYLFGLELTTHA